MKKIILSLVAALSLQACAAADYSGSVTVGTPVYSVGYYDSRYGYWNGHAWDRYYYYRGHPGYGHPRHYHAPPQYHRPPPVHRPRYHDVLPRGNPRLWDRPDNKHGDDHRRDGRG